MLQRVKKRAVSILKNKLRNPFPINYHQATSGVLAEEVRLACATQSAMEDVQLSPMDCPTPCSEFAKESDHLRKLRAVWLLHLTGIDRLLGVEMQQRPAGPCDFTSKAPMPFNFALDVRIHTQRFKLCTTFCPTDAGAHARNGSRRIERHGVAMQKSCDAAWGNNSIDRVLMCFFVEGHSPFAWERIRERKWTCAYL
eukprot:12428638-Karenia_brevis.AAC.1